MIFLHIVILALIQGITEFLPISSSGHLVLAHEVLGHDSEKAWSDNLMLDVAVHVGTLFSVLLYFRRDLLNIVTSVFNTAGANQTPNQLSGIRLATLIIIGSVPVIICGFCLYLLAPPWLRSVEIMAWMTLIFGILLGVADRFAPQEKELKDLGVKQAFLIGLSQAISLIPGTSRSGITMTTARALGFNRETAARYSLLLAIVAISGAGFLNGLQLFKADSLNISIDVLIAAILAFLSGWAAIALMMKWLEKASFMPFVIYRIIMGVVLLLFVYI